MKTMNYKDGVTIDSSVTTFVDAISLIDEKFDKTIEKIEKVEENCSNISKKLLKINQNANILAEKIKEIEENLEKNYISIDLLVKRENILDKKFLKRIKTRKLRKEIKLRLKHFKEKIGKYDKTSIENFFHYFEEMQVLDSQIQKYR